VSQLSSPINSVEDLRGKAVGTIPVCEWGWVGEGEAGTIQFVELGLHYAAAGLGFNLHFNFF